MTSITKTNGPATRLTDEQADAILRRVGILANLDTLRSIVRETEAAVRVPAVERKPACWACNDTGKVTTSSNGSGLIEAPCSCGIGGQT
jgi:hypothetical protein